MEASGEVPRGEKMLLSETDPESYITDESSMHIRSLKLIP